MVPAFAGAAQLHPPARVRGLSQRVGGGRDAGRHRAGAGRRRGGPVSERQRDAALPGDVVLRLVEAVAVERVHDIAWQGGITLDRKSTRLNSSHGYISYAVFCLKKKKKKKYKH